MTPFREQLKTGTKRGNLGNFIKKCNPIARIFRVECYARCVWFEILRTSRCFEDSYGVGQGHHGLGVLDKAVLTLEFPFADQEAGLASEVWTLLRLLIEAAKA